MTMKFDDTSVTDGYLRNGPPAFAPGHSGMLQMTAVLLAESVAKSGTVLIVGVGGGLETRYLASVAPDWYFVGVDPAPAMLELARTTAGPVAGSRLDLIEGTVSDAPAGPFDAATCILVLGLLPDDGSKLSKLEKVRERLKPNAAFILVDQCIDLTAPDAPLRLERYAKFALSSGVDSGIVDKAKSAIAGSKTMATASRNEELLEQAGFHGVEVFYVGMAWRGWVAYA